MRYQSYWKVSTDKLKICIENEQIKSHKSIKKLQFNIFNNIYCSINSVDFIYLFNFNMYL